MQIAYLNKGKIKAKPQIEQMLERRYNKDIHKCYLKNEKELTALGITEHEFVAKMKEMLNA
jgi:hypothetical protein